ncbi:anti-sigma factor domain-containing protein [Clostridium sp. BJN0001]|uniref:anti-sigma factor domain-containing protein n=1 Tax=Clostridium sp. BJN0001 TaxID=2930219 RepID=UPI001FD60B05|nr:anti-sigma factor domain-containing protein [Clostridium sp. BJN0001]
MNKGVVMELHKNYAIILNSDGHLEKIALKKDMGVGQKIFYLDEDKIKSSNIIKHDFHSNKFMFMKAFGSIAAIFLIAFTFLFGLGINSNKVYAVVSLDINPSIQIEADNNQIIIKAEGKNDDGKNLDLEDIIGDNINVGIEKIKDKLSKKDYLEKNKEVLIAFALTKGISDDSYKDAVETAVKDAFKDENITFVKANKEDIKAASDKGISLGRYKAFVVADDDTKENIDSVSVTNITAIIKEKENCIYWKAQDIAPEENEDIEDTSSVDLSQSAKDDTKESANNNAVTNNNNSTDSKNINSGVTSNNNTTTNEEKTKFNTENTEDTENKPTDKNNQTSNSNDNNDQTQDQNIPSEDIKPLVPSDTNSLDKKN